MEGGDEIFEIEDFTASTQWEKFMVKLEAALIEWETNDCHAYSPPNKNSYEFGRWDHKMADVPFGKVDIFATLHRMKQIKQANVPLFVANNNLQHIPHALMDVLDSGNNFCSHFVPAVVRWFGIRDFILVQARNNDVFNSDRTNHLCSSFLNAAINAKCHLPILLMGDNPGRHLYFGVCANENIRAEFATSQIKNCPKKLHHLSGWIAIFKEKVNCPLTRPPPVRVSIQMIYVVPENIVPSYELHEQQQIHSQREYMPYSNSLPFGMSQDPLDSIRVHCVWPMVNEEMLVESDVYCDVTPLNAPKWNASVAFNNGYSTLLHDCLLNYLKQMENTKTVNEILKIEDISCGSSALDNLTLTPAERAIKLPTKSTSTIRLPINQQIIDNMIDRIFDRPMQKEEGLGDSACLTPLSTPKHSLRCKVPGGAVNLTEDDIIEDIPHEAQTNPNENVYLEKLNKIVNCPLDCLTSRICVTLCNSFNSMQGTEALCQIWREIVLTLRFYWEEGTNIPGFDPEDRPDLGSCLLHQKITMLQCCITAKNKRMHLLERENSVGSLDSDSFFDCRDAQQNDSADLDDLDISSSENPMGRLDKMEGEVTLNSHPNKMIYIPVTQDSSPMTSDMVEYQMNLLGNLGEGNDSQRLRSEMQAAPLKSDMQAFKAANPGCELIDFVRWHSPRDFIIDNEGKGGLSLRMEHSGNIWLQTWNLSKPIPVSKQKRLFDYSKEAEKLLQYFEGVNVGELVKLSLPLILTQAIFNICNEVGYATCLLSEKLDESISSLPRIIRLNSKDDYLEFVKTIGWIETTVCQFRTLRGKFNVKINDLQQQNNEQLLLDEFTVQLMKMPMVSIDGAANSPRGILLTYLMCAAANDVDQTSKQDYINKLDHFVGFCVL